MEASGSAGGASLVAALGRVRDGSKINWVFWRGEDKAAKEGEAGILLIRRCSLTPAAAAAARQNAQVIFESAHRGLSEGCGHEIQPRW